MDATALISTVTTTELLPRLDSDTSVYLLDVREPDEVADWSIPGIVNIPLGQLEARLQDVPKDRDIVVICALGGRALQGATILANHGVASAVLEGGMSSWASTYDSVRATMGGATVIQVRRRGKGCLSYVIGAGTKAIVIDPSLDIEQYEALAAENGWQISEVLDTHLHADHLSGARSLVASTGATLRLSPSDPFQFPFEPLSDGLALELTADIALTVSAISVPGHTEGSTMYQLGDVAVFTGDTLFLESVGRPDLADHATEFAQNLYRSLHDRILPLPDETLIFPAHYGDVVEVKTGEFVAKPLGELRNALPALALDEASFVAWAVSHVKDRPPNYQKIVRVNQGADEISDEASQLELGPNRCAIAS